MAKNPSSGGAFLIALRASLPLWSPPSSPPIWELCGRLGDEIDQAAW